jgi:hypothetical protein
MPIQSFITTEKSGIKRNPSAEAFTVKVIQSPVRVCRTYVRAAEQGFSFGGGFDGTGNAGNLRGKVVVGVNGLLVI